MDAGVYRYSTAEHCPESSVGLPLSDRMPGELQWGVMKQVLQNVKSGETTVVDVPVPLSEPGKVLVQVGASLVSAGTERMVVDFAHKNLVQKARSRPDLVRQTVDKAKRDGVLTTFDAVQNRLDRPMTLGYSCAGRVIEVGAGITELAVGDAVACAGTGAAHAEIASVGRNLVARLPEGVGIEAGAFGTLGAIALQGMRLAEIQLGETVAVIGLGLLGQLTVQMLRAAGCVVVGMDLQTGRADLARSSGAHAVATDAAGLVQLCLEFSAGRGADSVLIAADTRSNDPVELAGAIARDRAVVVAVGAVGMNIPAQGVLRERAGLSHLALVRAGALRPGVRGGRARLSGRLRPLDRKPKHAGISCSFSPTGR